MEIVLGAAIALVGLLIGWIITFACVTYGHKTGGVRGPEGPPGPPGPMGMPGPPGRDQNDNTNP